MAPLSEELSSLREQVLANAVAAYPADVYFCLKKMGTQIIKPSEIFEVIITPVKQSNGADSGSLQAMLISLDPDPERRYKPVQFAAQGPTVQTALHGLIRALGEMALYNIDRTPFDRPAILPQQPAEILKHASNNQMSAFTIAVEFERAEKMG